MTDAARHIDSYYARTAAPGSDHPALAGRQEAEICIVGGGLAGLSAALSLAERGRKVALLEARRVGWGASGRNGGFVSPGFSRGLESLINAIGLDRTRELFDLTRDAMRLVRARIDRYGMAGASPVDSGMLMGWWRDEPEEAKKYQAFMAEKFGVEYEYWPRERVRAVCITQRYYDGLFRDEGFHFHPLNYARGVSAALVAGGSRVFEASPVTDLALDGPVKRVRTAAGEIAADTVIVACGGYIGNLVPRLRRAIKPIATYAMATEPLGERLKTAIRGNHAIHDSRFDFDYYRPLPDTRILWGHGISVFGENLQGTAETLRRHMVAVYPQLADVKIETAWGGYMSYPTHKMPQLGQLQPGVWYAQGYGGHGMGTTALTGELLAAAIAEGDRRYELLAPFGLNWTGGPVGTAYAQLVYWRYQFLDWLRG
ncbi:MAG: NAD(P)/FAD-dependent oxidoreductase [Dongiaceae bacterium]